MNAALYSVVEVNTHASETWSIVSRDHARALMKAGLIVALSGCGVAGLYQPGSASYVDSGTAPSDNLALSYLYGNSKALAAMGDPSWRGHYANYPLIYREMKVSGAYWGAGRRSVHGSKLEVRLVLVTTCARSASVLS